MAAELLEPTLDHPALARVREASAALVEYREVPVELMDLQQKQELHLLLDLVRSQAAAAQLGLLACSADLVAADGARDAGAWLAQHTRVDAGPARRDLRLADALASRWTRVAAALAGGEVNEAQARVIVAALDALPPGVESSVLADAEARLVGFAADFAPHQLRVLGRRILDVVAPEVGEVEEAKALASEEQRAQQRLSLSVHRLGAGCSRIVATVPDAVAHRLGTYLDAFTSPRHETMVGADRVAPEQQRGHAFCALLEAVDPGRLPRHGGDATTVVVTVTLEALRAGLASADLLGEDDRISAAQARRLACTAKVVPAVLGGDSEVLDLGRASRLFSPAQRKALRIRDQRCRAEGCTVPAPWCDAHHRRKPWSRGGTTDLADGVLLCNFHHHRAHDLRYLTEDLPSGDVRFRRRR